MSENCLIDQGSAFDCAALTQQGLTKRVILMNKVDYDAATITIDTEATEAITDIVLTEIGTQGYEFVMATASNVIATTALRKIATGADGYDHSIVFPVFDDSQLSKNNIEKLRFNKVVAIIEKVDGRGEVYGANQGMLLLDDQDIPGDAGTGGVIMITLGTPAEQPPEIHKGITVWDTDRVTTKAVIDSLLVPVSA